MAAITRAKRPEVKISVKDYTALETYCKGTEGKTPTKIISELVSEFLDRKDVKSVIAAQNKDHKKIKAIGRKRAIVEKLLAEIAELEEKI